MKLTSNTAQCFDVNLLASSAPYSQGALGRALRACLWMRVSTHEQSESDRAGLARQRAAIEHEVRSKGYEVVEEITLIDVSGTAVLHAPETRALMARVDRGEIDVLVAAEMSRLIRPDDLSSFELLECLKRNNVGFNFSGTEISLNTPEGFLAGGIQAMLGGFERMQMMRKMNAAKEARRSQGKNPGSAITLPTGIGYDRKTDKYTYTVAIGQVIEAFRLVDEMGIRNLAEVGRRTNLQHRSVRNVLRNAIYKGIRIYDMMRDPSKKNLRAGGRQGDRPKIKRPKERIIKVRVFSADEQAVSDERWDRVQAVLASIAENHEIVVATKWLGSLLTGTGRCGYCSGRFYAKTKSRKFADGASDVGHYLCRSHHETSRNNPDVFRCAQPWTRKAILDELAEAFLLKFLEEKDFVSAIFTHARAKQSEKVVSINLGGSLETKLKDLQKRDNRLLEAMESEVISIDEFKQRRERLTEEKNAILSAMKSQQQSEAEEERDLTTLLGYGVERWKKLKTTKEKKAFLGQIFTEIYFRGDSISAFRFAPTLVSATDPVWGFATTMPVALEPFFRITPLPVVEVIPDGHRKCTRCKEVKPLSDFHKMPRSVCILCCRKRCADGYQRRKEAMKSQAPQQENS